MGEKKNTSQYTDHLIIRPLSPPLAFVKTGRQTSPPPAIVPTDGAW